MSKREIVALRKGTNLLSSAEDATKERYSDKFFEKLDLWERVFELRSQGVSFNAISKTLKLNRKTVVKYYHQYVDLKQRVMEGKLSEGQMSDITEHIERMEQLRQELAFELASMGASEKDGPSPDEQMAKIATRKMLLDVEKQIAAIKRGLGLWHPVDPNYFKEKKSVEMRKSFDEKRKRLEELLEKGEK